MNTEKILKEINFSKSKDGLVPVVTQDFKTNEVLMLAYMNQEAFIHTLKSGNATYWSRSRNKLWIKGESSGNFQKVKEICLDCDGDTILLKVIQLGNNSESGASCHEGYKSCFFRTLNNDEWKINSKPLFDPKEVYKK